MWRPRSPAELSSVMDGGDLGGARVCRGAWRYAPLPQREVGNLALQRRSRDLAPQAHLLPRSGISLVATTSESAAQRASKARAAGAKPKQGP